jgi:hypothetical protein
MRLYDLAGVEDDLRFSPNCWRIKILRIILPKCTTDQKYSHVG